MNEFAPLLIFTSAVLLFSIVLLLYHWKTKNEIDPLEEEIRHSMKTGTILKRVLRYGKSYRKSYIGIFAIILVSILYDTFSPIMIGEIEELIKSDFELSELIARIIVFASILLVSMIALYFQGVLLQKVGQKILSAIREELFIHIESLSHNQLNHIPVGKLVTRETNDTNALAKLFTEIITSFAKSIVLVFGVIAAMFVLNVELSLMVFAVLPFIVFFTSFFEKFMRKSFRRTKNAMTDVNTFLSENLSGMKVTQIFNNEDKKLREFKKKNDRVLRAHDGEIAVFAIFRPLVYLLHIGSTMCVFFFAGRSAIYGTSFLGQEITAGILVMFYFYIQTLFDPIQRLAEMFNSLQSAVASAEKILIVLDMEPEIRDAEDVVDLPEIKGEIEFRNVWFAYHPDEWILKDVSFRVSPGETVALVGETGAGKSTILSLVTRNYDIQKGQILVDGVDIRKIKLACLRRHFGAMLQDVFLFAGTVRSNITLREDFSDEEVLEACHYVNADRFIHKLEEGLDTEVRERGNNFSQGERQLLSFARTVLYKPAVMILDEATANIDTETEQLIQASLEKMMNIGTMLIVAHRLSTIQHADKIIVINHGEIMESGNHFELLEKRGPYYELYKLQYEEK